MVHQFQKKSAAPQHATEPTNKQTKTPGNDTELPKIKTILSETIDLSKRIFRDETSGLDVNGMGETIKRERDLILGKHLADGIKLTYHSGRTETHIRNRSIERTLRNIAKFEQELAETLDRHEIVFGRSPSKSALRVFSIMLQKIATKDDSSRAHIKEITNQAFNIDLKNPNDKNWSKELKTSIASHQCNISLTIKPVNFINRWAIRLIDTDIPKEDRANRYRYEFKISPDPLIESKGLQFMKDMGRQAVAIAGLTSPLIASTYAMTLYPLGNILPSLSKNPATQNLWEEGITAATLVAIASASMALYGYLSNRR